ncbi:MAG: NAD-dependent epimerase/dehydratase family protein [Chitinophagaceae bacterium]|nr:NAD-dependent epimerase/dehydratase family protein [Chitinophagaceae bacterium]
MIVITGASGLLGRHLVKVLSAEAKPIKALYNSQIPEVLPGTRAEFVTWVKLDLLNYADVEAVFAGAEQVYHAAGLVSYDARDYESLFLMNEEGTAYVVNACLSQGVKKLGFVSSVATLGHPLRAGDAVDEQSPIDEEMPVSVYARSKRKAEREVWRGFAEGLDMVIVNPSIIIGDGDGSKSSSSLLQQVYDEFSWYTEGATGWVDAEDVANALVALMRASIVGERFVVSAENRSFKDVFTLMAKVMQKRPPHRKAASWMVELVWRLDILKARLRGSKPLLTRETARAACEVKAYSSEKLHKALPNFKYRRLEDSIARSAAYFLGTKQNK